MFFLWVLLKITKITNSMEYELFTAIIRQSEIKDVPKIRWFILATIKKITEWRVGEQRGTMKLAAGSLPINTSIG